MTPDQNLQIEITSEKIRAFEAAINPALLEVSKIPGISPQDAAVLMMMVTGSVCASAGLAVTSGDQLQPFWDSYNGTMNQMKALRDAALSAYKNGN